MVLKIPTLFNQTQQLPFMHYFTGLGLELMAGLIRILQPTDVVQIQHKIDNFNFKSLMSPEYVNAFVFSMFGQELAEVSPQTSHRLHVIDSVLNDENKQLVESGLTAVEKRTITILAHLGDCLDDHHEWFTDVKPTV